MATPDLVRDHAARLAGYLPRLEDEITEPTSPSGSAGMSPRPSAAPFPGNAQAFGVLTDIWAAVPELEARLRLEITGHPGPRHGGSTGNFLKALEAIVGLSGGLNEDWEAFAARALEKLNDAIERLPFIDEAQRWRAVPQRPCPYCGCFFLRVLISAAGQPSGRVECFGHTEAGEPCRAAWPGLLEIASDLEDANA